MERLGICGPDDAVRFVQQAQVHKACCEGEQRLDVAGIRRDPPGAPCRVTDEPERFADPAFVPADHRAGDVRRGDNLAAVLLRGGKDCGCYPARGVVVARPGSRLQVRDDRVVPEAAGQLRLGKHGLRVAAGVTRLAAHAPD